MFATAITAMLVLLSGCLPVATPHPGKPVTLREGEALVAGRIRMIDASNERIEYSPFGFDPWAQPFISSPGPQMTLELRKAYPPGGIYRYKARPATPIDEHGWFFWILAAGDYELLGNPRLLGSGRYRQEETETLAHFQVPASGGTVYLGTLMVGIDFTLIDMIRARKSGEAEYVILNRRVADEREQALIQLRTRFPTFPEPLMIDLMRVE